MDGNKVTGSADAKKKQPRATRTPENEVQESVYSFQDLIAGHKAFDVPKEIAIVALRLKGIKQATFADAKKIINEFKQKEVK